MPRLYGLFADLSGRQVLVVGGGKVAERKVAALLEAGALVLVAAPHLTARLAAWVAEGRVTHQPDGFREDLLDGCWLVVAATDDAPLNRHVADAAGRRQLLANVVDDVALSSFHVPAIVDRGPLQIAISTAGAAPAIARQLRAQLEVRLDESWGAMVALVARFRQRIQGAFPDLAARRHFFDRLTEGQVMASLQRRDVDGAEQALQQLLTAAPAAPVGEVVLVGAGPGDPGLLTLHAVRALQQADVVLHDRLVSDEVLQRARRDAELISVGKSAGSSVHSQEWINALLIAQARRGRRVVRLKGGDPFIFGRGGEELEALRRAGIPYRVVPGITAAAACAAYAGIPLTHRDHAQSVRFVTAHCRQSIDTLDWATLAQERQTLAVYMGVSQLGRIRDLLLAHGRAADTPFALIERGGTERQRVVAGTLASLPELAAQQEIVSPALLILGEVAALGRELAWYGAAAAPVVEAARRNAR